MTHISQNKPEKTSKDRRRKAAAPAAGGGGTKEPLWSETNDHTGRNALRPLAAGKTNFGFGISKD